MRPTKASPHTHTNTKNWPQHDKQATVTSVLQPIRAAPLHNTLASTHITRSLNTIVPINRHMHRGIEGSAPCVGSGGMGCQVHGSGLGGVHVRAPLAHHIGRLHSDALQSSKDEKQRTSEGERC